MCSPKIRQHVCTYLLNGSKILLFCHLCMWGQHIRHYLSLLHMDCLAVSTDTIVQVKRSDSPMFAPICHTLLESICEHDTSHVREERFSHGLLTGNCISDSKIPGAKIQPTPYTFIHFMKAPLFTGSGSTTCQSRTTINQLFTKEDPYRIWDIWAIFAILHLDYFLHRLYPAQKKVSSAVSLPE